MKISLLQYFWIALLASQTLVAGEWHATAEPVKIVQNNEAVYMNPIWSTDGRFLAFTKANYRGILIWDAEMRKVLEINDEVGAGFGMLWSQQKPALLARVAEYRGFRRYAAVKIFDVVAQRSHTIVPFQASLPDIPRWTSTGDVYYADREGVKVVEIGDNNQNLAKSKSDGNLFFIQRRSLTQATNNTEDPGKVPDFAGKRVINLSWSPDFTKVVFEVIGGGMFVMNADGQNTVDLGSGFRPKWSPDSRAITFMLSEDDGHHFIKSDVYIINADGSDRSEITTTPNRLEMNPSWGYDSRSLVYDVLGEGAIYSIDVAQRTN